MAHVYAYQYKCMRRNVGLDKSTRSTAAQMCSLKFIKFAASFPTFFFFVSFSKENLLKKRIFLLKSLQQTHIICVENVSRKERDEFWLVLQNL